MLKKLFLSIALVGGVLAAEAQIDAGVTQWGAHVSLIYDMPGNVNFKDPTSIASMGKILKDSHGIAFGASARHTLSQRFYVEPGLNVSYGKSDIQLTLQEINGQAYNDIKATRLALNVPLQAGVYFGVTDKLSFFLHTGPELNVGLLAKMGGDALKHLEELEGSKIPTNLYKKSGFPPLKRFDLGWRWGAGLQYCNVELSLGYTYGMLNQWNNSAATMHNSRFGVNVGYRFR